ncbi:MAG: HD domain-containing protein [Geobacter sp.]|nr:MAG: HD domain-containing protein [Geobacter sp.]
MLFGNKLSPLTGDDIDLDRLFSDQRLVQQIRFVLEVEKLKNILRMTPLLNTARRENDAEHTWELTLMAVVFAEHADEPFDLCRTLKMLIIHDIVEIDAGDTFIYDSAALQDQEVREKAAADRIFGLLPPDQAHELRELWDEFEACITPEARYARAIDRFQPLLHNFFTSGGTWHLAGATKRDVLDRKSLIGNSSTRLWTAAQCFINESVLRRFLTEDVNNGSK